MFRQQPNNRSKTSQKHQYLNRILVSLISLHPAYTITYQPFIPNFFPQFFLWRTKNDQEKEANHQNLPLYNKEKLPQRKKHLHLSAHDCSNTHNAPNQTIATL